MRSVACVLVCVALAGNARADLKATSTTTPHPGVTYQVYADAAIPARLHLVTIDVSSQEIHLYATQPGERGQTVSDFANCKKGVLGCVPSDVAINGDLFAPLGYVPAGFAVGGAKTWSDAAKDNATEGYFSFGRPADVNDVLLSPPSAIEQPPSSQATEGAVGGRTLLVQGGQAQSFAATDPTQPFRAAPRTAVGIDSAKKRLWVVVVDGDQAISRGLTSDQLGGFLVGLGVADALELDGGGASALYVRKSGGLVSAPSDGVERPVANHLGMSYGALPYRASIVGKVFDSKFNDDTKVINNATVTVDGKTATWNSSAPAHTVYNVDGVTPHFVCARASAPGFRTSQQCKQITAADIQASQIQYLSLVLFPGVDPPPDMSAPPDLGRDLSPGFDGGTVADGSAPADLAIGGGTGGCEMADAPRSAGGALGAGLALSVVLFLVAAAVQRRRRSRMQ